MDKLKVKICGMRDALNIEDIDKQNPDFLGFIFYPASLRYISDEITLPPTNSVKVGVFVNEMVSTILSKVQKHDIKTIQLHGDESVQTCQLLSDLGYDVIKAFRVDDNTTIDEIMPYKGFCKFFLYDTKAEKVGGTGIKFNWQKLNELDFIGEYFLSGGISPDDYKAINELKLNNLVGIDLNSKFEVKAAYKDSKKIQNFLVNLNEPLKT